MEVIDQILRLRGKRHVGLCPFHSEKAPSFTVDEEKQLYHCFGCGAGGDIFTLIMEKENLSFPEALKYLAEKYNIKLPERRKLSPQFRKLEEQLLKANEDTLAFFKKNLFNTKEGEKALDYLQKRKISSEIIQELKIGYALNSWDSLISFFQGKGIQPNLLEKAGLALYNEKKKSYYDRFRGRICKDAIRKKGYTILVEGYTDFLALYQAGIPNLTASLGTSLTSDQVSFAKRSERAISLCFEKGVQIKVLNLPQGYDPDSFVLKFGVDKFKELAQKSTPGLKFLIDTQLQGKEEDTAEEKAQIAKNIANEIEKIPDPVVRSEYLKQASEQLSIDENILRSMLQRKSTEEKEVERGIFLNAEKRLLQILLEEKEIAPYIFAEIKEEYFQDLKSKPIFNALSESFRKGKSSSLHDLKQKVDPSLVSSLSKAMLEKEQNATVEEAFECLHTLKQLSLENQAKKLKAELALMERKGEKEKIFLLIKQIQDTKKELSILSKRNYQNLSFSNRDGMERERSE